MCTRVEAMIALRYLRARRQEGLISLIAFFSLIGIALGVAALIVVLAVMNGVRDEMIKSIVGLDGHVSIQAGPRGIDGYDELAAALRQEQGVTSVAPVVQGQVMASHKGAAVGSMVSGMRADDVRATKKLLLQKIDAGDFAAFERGEGVIIGSRLAYRLGVSVGDAITLISPEGQATIAGMVPRVKAYPVVATFKIGMFAYDNGMILMPFDEAQIFFRLKRGDALAASALEVMANDPGNARELAVQLSGKVGREFRLYDWKSSNNHIFRAVIMQRNVMFVVLTLIIVVASFNVISSLIMLVRDKGKDIAILRTMGATRGMVMRIFFMCGASIGVLGTLLGIGLGLALALNTLSIQHWIEGLTGQPMFADELYFLSSLPSKVDYSEVVFVSVMALALSFLATLYPARKAARYEPAEALRYE